MRATLMLVLLAVFSALTCGAQQQDEYRQRQKINCDSLFQQAQQKNSFNTEVFKLKLGATREMAPLANLNSDLIKYGMQMKMLCQQYKSDPHMTWNQFWTKLEDLQKKQCASETSITEALPKIIDKVDVTKGTAQEKKK